MSCEVCGKDVFCLYFVCNDCFKPLPTIKECPPISMHFNPIKSKWFREEEIRIKHIVEFDYKYEDRILSEHYED